MKKLFSIIFAAALIIAFAGCAPTETPTYSAVWFLKNNDTERITYDIVVTDGKNLGEDGFDQSVIGRGSMTYLMARDNAAKTITLTTDLEVSYTKGENAGKTDRTESEVVTDLSMRPVSAKKTATVESENSYPYSFEIKYGKDKERTTVDYTVGETTSSESVKASRTSSCYDNEFMPYIPRSNSILGRGANGDYTYQGSFQMFNGKGFVESKTAITSYTVNFTADMGTVKYDIPQTVYNKFIDSLEEESFTVDAVKVTLANSGSLSGTPIVCYYSTAPFFSNVVQSEEFAIPKVMLKMETYSYRSSVVSQRVIYTLSDYARS